MRQDKEREPHSDSIGTPAAAAASSDPIFISFLGVAQICSARLSGGGCKSPPLKEGFGDFDLL
jgi:hypothetical protein